MSQLISLGRATSSAIHGFTTVESIIAEIQSGKWEQQIKALRNATGDDAAGLKKILPAAIFAGKFSVRKNDAIESFSGFICADIDKVQDRVSDLHDLARNDEHAAAAFVSPSGTGIKIVFSVPVALSMKEHADNFAAVREHVANVYHAKIDEAAKDAARLCFVSHDPGAFYKADSKPLTVVPVEEKKASFKINGTPAKVVTSRTEIAENILGAIQWRDAVSGFCKCPGEHLHTTPSGTRDAVVMLDGSPTVKCFHDSCASIIAGINHELRSQVGKAEFEPVKPAYVKQKFFNGEYLPNENEAVQVNADNSGLPPLIDAADFIATPIPQPDVLIEGMLNKGSKLVFGGGSKSYKTWCLLDLAISVASGYDWIGRRTTQGKVLFLNFEIQPHAWQQRIQSVANAKGVKIASGQITLWNLRGFAASFRLLIPKISARCKTENFSLIVLDPIYKIYGGADENSAGEVGELLNSIERLATASGAAIAFGAHFAKGNASGKEAIDRISGSGVFARDPDAILVFTQHEEEEAFTVEPILRNFAPVAPFAVRWNFPLMETAHDLDPNDLKQSAGRKKTYHVDDILNLIPQGGLGQKRWQVLAEENGVSERTFFRLKKELLAAGKVFFSSVEEKWLKTTLKQHSLPK